MKALKNTTQKLMKTKTFIDTNYLVGYAIKDNNSQVKVVENLLHDLAKEKIFAYTSIVVIFETAWTLLSYYKLSREEIVLFLTTVLSLKNFRISRKTELRKALNLYKETSLSLVDCYILEYAKTTKASKIATFDKKLLKVYKN